MLTPLPTPTPVDLETELEQAIAQSVGLLALLTDRATTDTSSGPAKTPFSETEVFGIELLKDATAERLQEVFKSVRPRLATQL
ncbi:hypothetical protein [Haloferula sp. BvORR071]|uniref:hypothetical protein n=1 Tax=Haloferula sp. BvORR071 TaxID=1396141 RepID=UPI000558F7F8|nr:hypothetical protein [Haloferula sp. BvORR071]